MLIQVIIALILIGVVLYLIGLVPDEIVNPKYKQVIRALVFVAIIIYVLLNIQALFAGNLLIVR